MRGRVATFKIPRMSNIGPMVASLLIGAGCAVALAAPKPPAVPAELNVTVAPTAVSPGDRARVTVRLDPIDGVQINRYPRITLKIPARDGLVPATETTVGNASPPTPGTVETNYFDTVDPLRLDLQVEPSAPRGKHKLSGNLTYFYCIKASGFCAPKKTSVEIPLNVR